MKMSSNKTNVTIFSAQGCKFCEKAKTIFTSNKIPFRALDVDFFPERYKKAAAHTQVSTVPLVFFGTLASKSFVGGASDVEKLLAEGKLQQELDERRMIKTTNGDDDGGDQDETLDFLAELSADEEKNRATLMSNRDAESDIFNTSMQDHKFVAVVSSHPMQIESKTLSFTYTELLNFLRDTSSKSGVAIKDRGIIFRRPKSVKYPDLVKGVDSFVNHLLKNSGIGAVEEFFSGKDNTQKKKELINNIITCLVCKVQMLYDAEQYALSKTSRPAMLDPSSMSDDTLFRFQVDNDVDLGGRCVLNRHRLLCSLQSNGARALDLSPSSSSSSSSSSTKTPADGTNNDKTVDITTSLNPAVLPGSDVIGRALWRAQDAMLEKFRDPKDGLVDYEAITSSSSSSSSSSSTTGRALLGRLEDIATLLQGVDLARMSDKEKIAFGINVYNSCVYHGFAVRGVPWSTLQKMSFFGNVGYLIGGATPNTTNTSSTTEAHFFCLNDIENGLLRGNRKGVTDFFSKPMSDSDPRLPLAVKNVDYRIHFALNCGAKSCPPVKVFTAANLDEELDAAAKSFLQSTSSWDSASKSLKVSMILKWYKEDFQQPTTAEVVFKYLSDDVKMQIAKDLGEGQKLCDVVGVEYAEYDWGFAAKKPS